MTAKIRPLIAFAVYTAIAIPSCGATFSFFVTMQAGLPTALGYELGAGSTSDTTESRTDFAWDPGQLLSSWRSGDLPQSFAIGYRQSTGTGYVRVLNQAGAATEASFTNAGAPMNSTAIWTLPVANFFASAASSTGPSSVNLENLSFSSGVQILSGALPASIGANYSGTGAATTSSLPALIVFTPASAGGDWTISGTIRFNGLFPASGSAVGSQLRFLMGAIGSDTPEASSAFLIGAGLLALGMLFRSKTSMNS